MAGAPSGPIVPIATRPARALRARDRRARRSNREARAWQQAREFDNRTRLSPEFRQNVAGESQASRSGGKGQRTAGGDVYRAFRRAIRIKVGKASFPMARTARAEGVSRWASGNAYAISLRSAWPGLARRLTTFHGTRVPRNEKSAMRGMLTARELLLSKEFAVGSAYRFLNRC